jgi:UDP-3-O-[3-hydroxymyristoyl] glucosamine N-acyltransferase
VAAKSAVFDDLPSGATVSGVPAFDLRAWRRAQALFRRLTELWREVRELRGRLAVIERRLSGEE